MNSKIVTIAGASGVVGSHLINYAKTHGYKLRILSRTSKPSTKEIQYFTWNPVMESDDDRKQIIEALEGTHILINLSGASISAGRLNTRLKQKILHSRLSSTRALIEAYKKCKNPPQIWGQASAVGYYGDTGDLTISEKNGSGKLFLSEVCVQWEATLQDLQMYKNLKVIVGRFGMVLSKDAPAWQKMLRPIQLGLGGPIGSGKQWLSWIDAKDLARAFFYLFEKEGESGIYNFTSPVAVRQKDLVIKTAAILHRPSFIWAPKFLVRAILGKIADEIIFASCRAIPDRLMNSGFNFLFPDIESELLQLLRKEK